MARCTIMITKPCLSIMLLVCLGASPVNADSTCSFQVSPAVQSLDRMRQQLEKATSRDLYQDVVKSRYDELDRLLTAIQNCDPGALPEPRRQAVKTIKSTLVALQSSSRTSAFTRFADWVDARQRELSLLEDLEVKGAERGQPPQP